MISELTHEEISSQFSEQPKENDDSTCNLKLIDELKHGYLQTLEWLRSQRSDLIRFTFFFQYDSQETRTINTVTDAKRIFFKGIWQCGKNNKEKVMIVCKSKSMEKWLENLFNEGKKVNKQYLIQSAVLYSGMEVPVLGIENDSLIFDDQQADLTSTLTRISLYLNNKYANQKSNRSQNLEANGVYPTLSQRIITQMQKKDGRQNNNFTNNNKINTKQSHQSYEQSISNLTNQGNNENLDEESVFVIDYSAQIAQMGGQLDSLNIQVLKPKTLKQFEGVITSVEKGSNMMLIDELVQPFYINTRRHRFYILKLRSAMNYLDELVLYLIYDCEDFEGVEQLQFYLHPFQRVLVSQCLRHINQKLQLFAVAYHHSNTLVLNSSNNPNFERFHMSQKSIEFFPRHDRILNEQLCSQEAAINHHYANLKLLSQEDIGNLLNKSKNQFINGNIYNNIKQENQHFNSNIQGNHQQQLQNQQTLQYSILNSEKILIRCHVKVDVRVKKIKYIRFRLNCADCEKEWVKGCVQCMKCGCESKVLDGFAQVLVQDAIMIENQMYIYLNNNMLWQFFNITESEKQGLLRYLNKEECYLQMYFTFNKNLPKEVSLLKDRLFTKDTQKTIVGVVFADTGNKLFTLRQEQRQKERDQKHRDKLENELNEKISCSMFEDSGCSKISQTSKASQEIEMMRRLNKVMNVNKNRLCMNGALMQTDFVLEQPILRSITCLKVVHVVPAVSLLHQTLNTLESINQLKQAIASF